MPPLIATFAYVFGIVFLFWLERDRQYKPSPALWLSIISLLIRGSRPLTLWFVNHQKFEQGDVMNGSPLDAAVGLGLIVAGAIVLAGRQKQIARKVKANLIAVVFISYCALSISWSAYPDIAFKRWIRFLGDLITVFIVLTDRDPAKAMKWVLTRVAFILIPVSILLIKYYPGLARYYDEWTGMEFVTGVSTDKNMLGMMCLVYGSVVLFSFLELWRQQRGRVRNRRLAANAVVLAMLFWLFGDARSMTSLACFYFASFLLVVTGFFMIARKREAIHLLVVGILGATASILFLHIGEAAALEKLGRNPTLTGRTEIWSGLIRFSGNPLFGTGYESFWLGERMKKIWASGSLFEGINEAHNGYLETYLNLGWIGVALFLGFIVTGYRNVMITLQRDFDTGRLKLAFFVVAIAYNFTEAGFRAGSSVLFAFLFAALDVPPVQLWKRSPLTKSDRARNVELESVARSRSPSFQFGASSIVPWEIAPVSNRWPPSERNGSETVSKGRGRSQEENAR